MKDQPCPTCGHDSFDQDLRDKAALKLLEQRDELLKALEKIDDILRMGVNGRKPPDHYVVNLLKIFTGEAIAATKGEV